jgi:hypothetical protein
MGVEVPFLAVEFGVVHRLMRRVTTLKIFSGHVDRERIGIRIGAGF